MPWKWLQSIFRLLNALYFSLLDFSDLKVLPALCFVYLFWSKLGGERDGHYPIIQNEPKINRSEQNFCGLLLSTSKKNFFFFLFGYPCFEIVCLYIFPSAMYHFGVQVVTNKANDRRKREKEREREMVVCESKQSFLIERLHSLLKFQYVRMWISLENVALMEFLGWAAFDLRMRSGEPACGQSARNKFYVAFSTWGRHNLARNVLKTMV